MRIGPDAVEAERQRLAALQSLDGQGHAAGHGRPGVADLHQHEFQPEQPRFRVGQYLQLLHLDPDIGVRLHQAAVESQVLVQPRDLALHVPEALFDLLVALAIDPSRHLGSFQLGTLLGVLALQRPYPGTGGQCAAHGIDDPEARIVPAELKRPVEQEDSAEQAAAQQRDATPGRVGANDQLG